MALWNNTDEAASKPKYLNTADKAATVGVDVSEAKTTANIAKGLNTPGWVKYATYTDAQGNTRHKSEVLVAMTSITGDDEDTVAADLVVTIGTQPVNTSVTAPATATFTVVATVNGDVALTYQWQKAESTANTVYADIVGATSASYTTGVTAVTAGPGATNGDKYRVVVTAGNASTTSTAVTLTVA